METTMRHSPVAPADVSFVMPCYNEESIVGYTLPKLFDAFSAAGHRLEVVTVDDGSTDRTGEVIAEAKTLYPGIVYHRVKQNAGYGNAILSGVPHCRAPWIGVIPADGQVDAEDVVRLYEAVLATDGNVVGKVRRRFRMDGLLRKIVSITYNGYFRLLWPRIATTDVNGSPKLVRADHLRRMKLASEGWLFDPELLITAHCMGLRILELNVFGRMRGNGLSHVKPVACWEFFSYLLASRFSSKWRSVGNSLEFPPQATESSA